MSTAERLHREGRALGWNEGRAQGRSEALLRLLERRFGSVPAEVTERVRRADLDRLDRWTDGILDAASLADLFAN
ncbi:MAG: DUF4351 domain-containing protein [Planctomycetes bacterium]|nr:DUF4351 domain-containing protein [Planctomycetota bacterium]